MCPARRVSTRIFKTYLCDPYVFNATLTRRFLHDDLNTDCNTVEYDNTYYIATAFVLAWPVG
jgi:hypothetical protein